MTSHPAARSSSVAARSSFGGARSGSVAARSSLGADNRRNPRLFGAKDLGMNRLGLRRLAECVVVSALFVTAVSCSGLFGSSDPVELRKSLEGVDVDGNGVRDDVDAKVPELTTDKAIAAQLLAYARHEQMIITFDTEAPDAAEAAFQLASETFRILSCQQPAGINFQEWARLTDEAQRAVFDPRGRKAKLNDFQALIDARAFMSPDCDQLSPTTSSYPSK